MNHPLSPEEFIVTPTTFERDHRSARIRRHVAATILIAAVLIVGPALSVSGLAATTTPVSLFSSAARSQITLSDDTHAVEVGVRFQTSVAGTVTALRYYKPANSPVGTKSGHLWSATGASARIGELHR